MISRNQQLNKRRKVIELVIGFLADMCHLQPDGYFKSRFFIIWYCQTNGCLIEYEQIKNFQLCFS